tara:strand:+ start:1272 stop:1763 length:492 start_codon:yes stop_codon:yes gene_type:complete
MTSAVRKTSAGDETNTSIQKHVGGCYCGNVTFDIVLSQPPSAYHPRACDCDFCRKYGASYLSDPQGCLSVNVEDAASLGRFHQGYEAADFLICRICGVLVGACYEEGGTLYATINARCLRETVDFGETVSASPKKLSKGDRIDRWKQVWFSNVQITASNSTAC